ncbi:zinc finger protein 185 isoform X2 [Pithys albifrons albifrons]|uniref:zinc finger protein 185 isoform X2 n=1 Tax=Pithys albifrons albifrons TaxID=3385563 RepID=UPI003A5D0482
MMSLGVTKGGIIPPTDEDRRRIIKQMKVRTTLRGDKSWIQHHTSDSEDEKKSSPLPARAGGGSPAPKPPAPQHDRSPVAKPQPGYLIRGVFTRTIDKAPSGPNSSCPNQAQKSSATKGQSPGRSPSGYRMTTEDYKKLAPYNVRQKAGNEAEQDVPFSADEHKKRTEAANSVLRSSASRERAYVLSAAKKSSGSPTQEFPPLFAKRIEIEEEQQHRRSPTMPGPRGLAPKGSRNGEHSQAVNGTPASGAVAQRGHGAKAPEEKPELLPWDGQAPRDQEASRNGSLPEHSEATNGFYTPRSSLDSRDRPVDELLHQYKSSLSLDDGRSSWQPDVPPPATERAPGHTEDMEYSFRRFSGSTTSLTERGQGPPGHGAPPELPRAQEPTAQEPGMVGSQESTGGSRDMDMGVSPRGQSEEFPVRRSSSGPAGSTIPAPEAPPAEESEPQWDRITPTYKDQTIPIPDGHQESQGVWRHSEPGMVPARSEFSSREEVLGTQDPQPFFGAPPSHRIPAYVDSQVFSTSRPSPDAQGRVSAGSSSPRSGRAGGARGHGEFTPLAGHQDSLPRDAPMALAQRSHRVPFYMDSLNYNSTRLLSGSSERLCSPHLGPAGSGYQPDSSSAGRGILFVKQYVNSGGVGASPRYGSLVDLSDLDRASYSHHSYLSSTPLLRPSEPLCTYCGREIRDCPKIIIEHLNIHCHEFCFRCGICHKAMGDLLDKIFIHRDIVHCDKCYEKLF